jgi:hypothetical protein
MRNDCNGQPGDTLTLHLLAHYRLNARESLRIDDNCIISGVHHARTEQCQAQTDAQPNWRWPVHFEAPRPPER